MGDANSDKLAVNGQTTKLLYQEAVSRLNALQSNAITLAISRGEKRRQRIESNVNETHEFLQLLDISLDDIDRMNVIHITGTKGKGSTAAFLESILRSLGYKTGFYSSPHLVHARERIRLNGRPISERCFADNLFEIYNKILERKMECQPMPAYFKFLTLLAFHIFRAEQIDVAIVEVGIGGEHDCTNVIRSPIVCAISTLDFDHTKLLGNTLAEIAWNKAGIAKPGSVLLSVDQPPDALAVIRARCAERQCPLLLVPPISAYRWPPNPPIDGAADQRLGIAGPQQHTNASLALQLARQWLRRRHQRRIEAVDSNGGENLTSAEEMLQVGGVENGEAERLGGFALPPLVADALSRCRWPGRGQTVRRGAVLYHLDGAHTPQSTQFCAEWFVQSSARHSSANQSILRVLIFHCTGDRNSSQFLPNFTACRFDLALFCPALVNPPDAPRSMGMDNTNMNIDPMADWRRSEKDAQIWAEMNQQQNCSRAEAYTCMSATLARIDALAENNSGAELHVLVTGSLHLVGSVLALLDPDFIG